MDWRAVRRGRDIRHGTFHGATNRNRHFNIRSETMSLMCKLDGKCTETKGMCIHEKMMATMVVMLAVAATAHWGFHLF